MVTISVLNSKKYKKNRAYMHFFSKIFADLQKMLYLCSVSTENSPIF